jgi:hypothetical protein
LQKDALAVGDSTQLEIIFNTGAYASQVTKTPRITTNEGQPDKMVRITANVETKPDSTFPVVLRPYKLDLTQFGEKVRSEIKFDIQNMSAASLTPQLVSGAPDYFEVVLPKQIGAGQTGKGLVKLKKDALDKTFDKSLTFQLNDEKSSRFTVPVHRSLRTTGGAAAPNVAVPVTPTH